MRKTKRVAVEIDEAFSSHNALIVKAAEILPRPEHLIENVRSMSRSLIISAATTC